MFFADTPHVFQPIVIDDIIFRALIAAKRLFWGKGFSRVVHLVWLLNFGSLVQGLSPQEIAAATGYIANHSRWLHSLSCICWR